MIEIILTLTGESRDDTTRAQHDAHPYFYLVYKDRDPFWCNQIFCLIYARLYSLLPLIKLLHTSQFLSMHNVNFIIYLPFYATELV